MAASKTRTNGLLRLMDRLVGVPALWLLGLLHARRGVPASMSKIGLLKSACIGDTVLMSGVVRDIHAAFPAAEIVLFVGPSNAEVAGMIPGVGRVVVVPVTSPWRAIRAMRQNPTDVLLDFGAWPRIDALLAGLSRASFTAGYRTPGQGRHYLYDAVVDHSQDAHEVENYQALVRTLGINGTNTLALRVRDVPLSLRPVGRYAVLHIFSGGYRSETKEWPAERWVALAAELLSRNVAVVLTGSHEERTRAEALREQILVSTGGDAERVLVAAGRTALAEAASLVHGAWVVVSVNTGLMHMAAAMGVATVSLDGSVRSQRWGPIGPWTESVGSSGGPGYISLGFEEAPASAIPLMQGIDVARVMAAVERVTQS